MDKHIEKLEVTEMAIFTHNDEDVAKVWISYEENRCVNKHLSIEDINIDGVKIYAETNRVKSEFDEVCKVNDGKFDFCADKICKIFVFRDSSLTHTEISGRKFRKLCEDIVRKPVDFFEKYLLSLSGYNKIAFPDLTKRTIVAYCGKNEYDKCILELISNDERGEPVFTLRFNTFPIIEKEIYLDGEIVYRKNPENGDEFIIERERLIRETRLPNLIIKESVNFLDRKFLKSLTKSIVSRKRGTINRILKKLNDYLVYDECGEISASIVDYNQYYRLHITKENNELVLKINKYSENKEKEIYDQKTVNDILKSLRIVQMTKSINKAAEFIYSLGKLLNPKSLFF